MSKQQKIDIRVSKEEKDRLTQKARKAGVSVSTFIRHAISNTPVNEAPTAEFHEVIRYLRQNGSTLDQLLRLARLRELDTESLEIALAHNHATEQMLWDILYLSL